MKTNIWECSIRCLVVIIERCRVYFCCCRRVYLPNFFLKARVLFINFLCLCLFIFKRRFLSTLVNSSSSTTSGVVMVGCGTAGALKGRRREIWSKTLAVEAVSFKAKIQMSTTKKKLDRWFIIFTCMKNGLVKHKSFCILEHKSGSKTLCCCHILTWTYTSR